MPARRIISSRPLVEFSIQVEPGFSVVRICVSTFSDTVGEGRQVKTASTFEASSAGEAAQVAPSFRWRSASFGSRS